MKYGLGTAKATITGYTSGTQVTATITSAFSSTSAIASGSWSVATMNVTGLTWLEGETVSILADGYYAGQDTVSSGEVAITAFCVENPRRDFRMTLYCAPFQ